MGWTANAGGTAMPRPWTSPIMSSGNRLMCHAVAVLPLRLPTGAKSQISIYAGR
jgi:hypothetical protein